MTIHLCGTKAYRYSKRDTELKLAAPLPSRCACKSFCLSVQAPDTPIDFAAWLQLVSHDSWVNLACHTKDIAAQNLWCMRLAKGSFANG